MTGQNTSLIKWHPDDVLNHEDGIWNACQAEFDDMLEEARRAVIEGECDEYLVTVQVSRGAPRVSKL